MNQTFRNERGTCRVCGGDYAVSLDGAVRPHRPSPPLLDRLAGRRTSSQPRCPGSRTLSAEAMAKQDQSDWRSHPDEGVAQKARIAEALSLAQDVDM